MDEIRIYSPTAILGYGYPPCSLENAIARRPDAIAVDAGSTDGGPAYLGIEPETMRATGQAASMLEFVDRDVGPLLELSCDAGIPLLVGSAGFAGGNVHLAAAQVAFLKAARERGLRFTMAKISAEVDRDYVKEKLRQGRIQPLGPAPELSEAEVDAAVRIVAQMGVEPFIEALRRGAQVVLAGRANDPSMFAALPLMRGFDRGLALHMAKILECGAIAADPGSGSDGLLGTLRRDHFLLEALSPERRCTVRSVAAHSLYEKSDPVHLYGPGGATDLSGVRFEQVDERRVKVSGSRFVPAPRYQLKLEGAKRVGFRAIAVAGVRDPGTIAHLDELIDAARSGARAQFSDLSEKDYQLAFHVYGRNAVMGELDPYRGPAPHELGLVIEAVAANQALATGLCGHARSVMLHHGFEGRMSTAGNLAFPFSPLDIPAGPVYAFNIYHLMDEEDPLRHFPIEMVDVGAGT
jgi:hypothetical protein